MDAFENSLKAAFAESHEPAADETFVAHVQTKVRRHEATRFARSAAEIVGFAAGATAVAVGISQVAIGLAPDILVNVGMGMAQARTAMSGANFDFASLGVGLTQILLVASAITGGAVLYRNQQQQ